MWPIEAFIQKLDIELHPGMLYRAREAWALCVQDPYNKEQRAGLLLEGEQVGAVYSIHGHMGPVMTLARDFAWRATIESMPAQCESYQTACLCITDKGPVVTGRHMHMHESDGVVGFTLRGQVVGPVDFGLLRNRSAIWDVQLCPAGAFKNLGVLLHIDRSAKPKAP